MSTIGTSNHRSLTERMRAYGCPELIPLDEPPNRPEQMDYLDLLPGPRSAAVVHAVAEHQGTALLYLLDADPAADAVEIPRLQKELANRSDPAWLGVVRPGSLELHPIGFPGASTAEPLLEIEEDSSMAPFFFQSLVHGDLERNDEIKGSDYVFKKIYELLTQTVDAYVEHGAKDPILDPLHILSMTGRALFFRFLVDRRIVREAELSEICPAAGGLKECFANAENAARSSAWLDETFNGDFLQLVDESIPGSDRHSRYHSRYHAYARYYRGVEKRAGRGFFNHLHAILNGWRSVGGGFQMTLDWDDFDFAHIPVGVLSQVYESFSHRVDPRAARSTSTHYTPRNVARLIVDQVFAASPEPARAKVLDPACGAGIFLVLTFRRLVQERWRVDGKRPNTATIQKILYRQLRGFDISEPALRLAALALYVTAIEINGSPRPPKSLRFPKNLRDTVLFRFAEDGSGGVDEKAREKTLPLGSLGPGVPARFDGAFDIVIGNPPWTRLRDQKSAEMNREFTEIGRRGLRGRGLGELAEGYENPDKNPDLPFLWRAAEWAKKDEGLIAFTLPARIFGRTSGKGFDAWRAVLRAFSVTGLINGADLRKTPVWEAVDMPFCLLFARNAAAPEDHRFYYTAPKYEPPQNGHARFRIDYESTQPIRIDRVQRQPWILKTLGLGTWWDVEIIEKIEDAFPQTLGKFWKAWNPEEDKTGKGYDRSPKLKQKPADFLADLPDFKRPKNDFSIRYSSLEKYRGKYDDLDDDSIRATAYWPKTEELYQPPLVIVPQSPGDDPESAKAYISDRPLAFSQSFYGYSCAEHPESASLAALLYLLPHSTLFSYFSLMTSRRTGFDRQTFNKEELDAITFPDPGKLPAATRNRLQALARRLEHDARKPWREIDSFLFKLYGLDEDDAQTIRDTLFSAAAYRHQGRAAIERTSRENREPFRAALQEMLEPYFDVCGEKILIEEPPAQDTWRQPWFFLAISRADKPPQVGADLLRTAMQEANRRAASRVLVRAPDQRGLLLGLLNQRRWWTRTRARLCAQHILRDHLEAFGLA